MRGWRVAAACAVLPALIPIGASGSVGERSFEEGFLFGGANSDQFVDVSAVGDQVYVVGSEGGLYDGNPQSWWTHGVLVKYRLDGGRQWARSVATHGTDHLEGVAASSQGVAYVGTTSGEFLGTSNAGEYDAFLGWFAPDGQTGWIRQFGGPGGDSLEAVAISDALIYTGGYTHDSLDAPTSGDADVIVRAYAVDGDLVWAEQFGTPTEDAALDLAVHNGAVYVGGITGLTPGAPGDDGDSNGLIARLDAATGDVIWTSTIGTPAYDTITALATDGKRIYVGGVTLGHIQNKPVVDGEGRDGWLAAIAPSGSRLWARQVDADYQAEVEGLTATTPGVVATGSVFGTLAGQTADAPTSAWLRAYNASGDSGWTHQFAGPNGAVARDVNSGKFGLYVVGSGDPGYSDMVGEGSAFLTRFTINRPDLRARIGHAPLAWDNVYPPEPQSSDVRIEAGRASSVRLSVQNDGEARERFTVSGCAPRAAMRIRWFVGTSEVTAAIRSGTYRTPRLGPGAAAPIRMRIWVDGEADPGVRACRMLARSAAGPRDRMEVEIDVVN